MRGDLEPPAFQEVGGGDLKGGADDPDEISNYPFVNKKMGKHELTSGPIRFLKNIKSTFEEINKVGEAIMTARSGQPSKAIDYIGDSLAYILDKTGVTPTDEEGYYKEFYNSKIPSNLSSTFGALQPFQYYNTAFIVYEDKVGQWQTKGRSPVDIAEAVKIHPYWTFDQDFGIWYMSKKPDENYPFMIYPKDGEEKWDMWWWRGSFIESLSNFDSVLEYPDGSTEKYTKNLYIQQKPKIMKIIQKLYDITNEERNVLIESYNLLEENIIAQVANMYVKETETDPSKFVPDWDKMTKEERVTYAKLSKFKPAPEKSIPQIDYYSTIKGDVKDRGDKKQGEYEFTPIKGRDTWNVLWKRGYKKYADFIESNEGKKAITEALKSKYDLKIEEREKEFVKEEVEKDIEQKTKEKAQLLEKKPIQGVEKDEKPQEVKETLGDVQTRLDEIDDELKSDPMNQDLKNEREQLRMALKNIGGWSTKAIEEGKNEKEEIEYQKKYHNILKREIEKNNQSIKEGLTQKEYEGDGLPTEQILANLPFGPEDIQGLTSEQRSLKHDELFKSPILQRIKDPREKWRVYDIIRDAVGLEKDKGIELSRGLPVPVESSALRNMKALKQQKETKKDVFNKEAYDRAIQELEGIEAKREEIKGRLSRAEQKQKAELQKTKDDLDAKYEELKKQIDELKALKGKAKSKGRPTLMKKSGGAEEPEAEKKKEKTLGQKFDEGYKKLSDIGSQVDKAIAITDKIDSIAGKVDKFLDRITPADGPQKRIIKEETRKDTELQKQAEWLIENYEDLEEEEAIKKYLALEELADKKAKEAEEKLQRDKNIQAQDEKQKKLEEEKKAKRETAKARLSKHIMTGGEVTTFSQKLDKAKQAVEVADKIADQLDKFGPKLDGRVLKSTDEEKGQKTKFRRGEGKNKADLEIYKKIVDEIKTKYSKNSPKVGSFLIKRYKQLYLDKHGESPFENKQEEKILLKYFNDSWQNKPEIKGGESILTTIRGLIKKYARPSLSVVKDAVEIAKQTAKILAWWNSAPESEKTSEKLEEKVKEEVKQEVKEAPPIEEKVKEALRCASDKITAQDLLDYDDTCDRKKLGVLTLKLQKKANEGCPEQAEIKRSQLHILAKNCAKKRQEKEKEENKGGAKKVNSWMEHVKKVKSENEGMKYKDVLILAKKSYSKK